MLDVLRVLVRARRRRLPDRRAAPDDQGRPAARQPAQPGLGARATTRTRALLPEFTTDRPEVQDAIRDFRATVGDAAAGGRALPADRAARRLLRLRAWTLPSNFHLLTTPWNAHDVAELIETLRGRAARRRAGRTGCSATTTGRAWRRACRPATSGPRPRSCSRCAGRRRSTTATRSACATSTIPPERRVDPWAFGNRDPVRTPMQWDARRLVHPGGGAVAAVRARPRDASTSAAQREDPDSLLNLYRRAARRAAATFADGALPHALGATTTCCTYARGDAVDGHDRLRHRRRRSRGCPRPDPTRQYRGDGRFARARAGGNASGTPRPCSSGVR